jgi:pyridoxal biosynthesis lyase PdxS
MIGNACSASNSRLVIEGLFIIRTRSDSGVWNFCAAGARFTETAKQMEKLGRRRSRAEELLRCTAQRQHARTFPLQIAILQVLFIGAFAASESTTRTNGAVAFII